MRARRELSRKAWAAFRESVSNEKRIGRLAFTLLAVSVVVELLAVYALATLVAGTAAAGVGLPTVVLLHVMAALAAALPARASGDALALLGFTLLVPMGVLVRTWDVFVRAVAHRQSALERYQKFIDEMGFKPLDAQSMAHLGLEHHTEEERTNRSLLLAPVASILADESADSDLKLAAVRNLTHLRPQDSVPLMKEALKNDEPTVRYYAAKLLAQLENEYTRRLREAESVEGMDLDEDQLEEIAMAHLALADSKLLDEGEVLRHREWALENLEAIEEEERLRMVEARRALPRVLLELGRSGEALREARAALLRDPEDVELYRTAMEASLKEADMESLKRLGVEMAARLPDSELAQEVMSRFESQPTSA